MQWLSLSLIIVIGFLRYFPVIPHVFRGDDFTQIVNNPFVHSISSIPLFFITSIPEKGHQHAIFSYYYKPFLFIIYSIIYWVGHGQVKVFYDIQILLACINSFMLFIFFKKFFRPLLALFLSLLFLLHPTTRDLIMLIANLQDLLFFTFGMSALLVISSQTRKRDAIVIGLLLLLSLLTKETAIIFFIIILLYCFFFSKKQLPKISLTLLITFIIYFLLRIIGQLGYFATIKSTPFAHLPLVSRILQVPVLMSLYLTDLIAPNLLVPQHVTLPLNQFLTLSMILLVITICGVMGAFGYYLYQKKSARLKLFLFFCCWLWVGLLFHSQLLPLDAVFTRRWLYFSLAGIVGMIGILIEELLKIKYPREESNL